MSCYLGIDIGTSGTKTLAIDVSGNVLAESVAEYPVHQPRPGLDGTGPRRLVESDRQNSPRSHSQSQSETRLSEGYWLERTNAWIRFS